MFTSGDSENTSCVVEFGANVICLLKVLIQVYCVEIKQKGWDTGSWVGSTTG